MCFFLSANILEATYMYRLRAFTNMPDGLKPIFTRQCLSVFFLLSHWICFYEYHFTSINCFLWVLFILVHLLDIAAPWSYLKWRQLQINSKLLWFTSMEPLISIPIFYDIHISQILNPPNGCIHNQLVEFYKFNIKAELHSSS